MSEAIAREIVHQIARDRLPRGAKLPAEQQMMAQYGIGRASLREALRILEVYGLVEIRPGPKGGPVVAGVDSASFGRMASLHFQMARATFRELVEARLVMEPVMARLAAQRRDPEQVEALGENLETAQPRVLDESEYLRTGTEFHGLVSGMSGNRVLDLIARGIKDIYTDRLTGMVFPPSRRKAVRRDHEAIGQEILAGHGARAEELMRAHMEQFAQAVGRLYPGLMDTTVDWD